MHLPVLPFHHPARWVLALLSLAILILAILVARVRRANAKSLYKEIFGSNVPRERMLFASVGFYFAFASVRVITHAIRAGRGPFHDIAAGGLRRRFWSRLLAFVYGVGAALTLDEFALWLNLRDVYWEREGRESIDAILLFSAVLSISIFRGRFFHALAREAFGGRARRQSQMPVHQP